MFLRPLKPPVTSVPAVGDLEGEQGQRQRDHGEERPGQGAPAKHQEADAPGQQARRQRRPRQQEQEQPAVPEVDQRQAGEIRGQPEEHRLSQRQQPRLAPAQADAERRDGVEEIERQRIGPELAHQMRQDGECRDQGGAMCEERGHWGAARETEIAMTSTVV